MNKIYEKNELNFALIWIGIYVVLYSVGDSFSKSLGMEKVVTAPISILLTVILYLWISKNGLKKKYGICTFEGSAKTYLYFIPLVLLSSTNVWFGVCLNYTVLESILFVISMCCVGFLEEVIFRGLLFKALCKNNIKQAIIISSVTFGIGHIVNLLNGREVFATLMQICYAIMIGFVFTIIFYKGKSLWPCIITHCAINSLSGFANRNDAPEWHGIVTTVFLSVVSLVYALYIINKTKEKSVEEVSDK